MDVFLKTDRIILRQIEEQDWELLQELDSDPEVMRYLSHGVPSPAPEIDRALNIMLGFKQKFKGELGFWIALDLASQSFIGWFHLRPLKAFPDDIDKLEIGYRLKKKYWGKGLATEGAKALLDLAIKRGTSEVWAHTMLGNTGSSNVMKKIGLQFHREELYEAYPGPDKRCVWYWLKSPNNLN